MHTLAKTIFTLTLLLVSSVSFANTSSMFSDPYLQLSGGGSTSGDNYGVVKLSGGTKLTRNIGIEGGALGLTSFFTGDINVYYVAAVVSRPINEKFSIAGKLGVAAWDSSCNDIFCFSRDEDDGTNAMAGVELKYDISKSFSGVVALEHYGKMQIGNQEESVFTASLGLRYTFK